MKIYDAKTSFASGELSPALYARIDMAQYATGARELTNFIVLPQGAIINRPGVKRLNIFPAQYETIKLVPFVFSEDDSCVLVFYGNGGVGVFDGTHDGAVEYFDGGPYRPGHFKKLRWLQSGDVLYLFHPGVPVHTLSRTSSGWKFEKVEFENGPFEDMNTDPDTKIECKYNSSSDEFDISFSGPKAIEVNALILYDVFVRVEQEVQAQTEELYIPKGGSNSAWGSWVTIENVFGPFTYRTSGKWTGDLEVERCRPDGWQGKSDPNTWVWESFKSYTSETNAEENFSYSGTVEEYANHYRFRYRGGKAKVTVNFSYEGGLDNRVFKITGQSGSVASMTCSAKDIDGKKSSIQATDAWALGSFGPHYGYPSMGIFHQERLVLAKTYHSPQTIYMSQPASWHNFGVSVPTQDDDAITVTLASKEINEIRGLASRGELLIFTAGGEWSARAGSKSDVITPSSIVITPSGYRGSAYLEPLDVGDVTLFVQRQGTVVRSIGYSLEVDGYSSNDVSILASHMFEDNPVVAWAYQQTPWSLVWCVLKDGKVATLTLQKEHQVTAWTRQTFPRGKVIDVCSIPGDNQDDVYLAIKNGFGDYGDIYLCRLKHRNVNDNMTFWDEDAHIFKSVLECLDWEVRSNGGTAQGRYKHMPVMTLRLWETNRLKGIILTENTPANYGLDELQFPLQSSPGPYASGLFSGDVRLLPQGGVARTCRVRLESTMATPVMILGIFPEILVSNEEIKNEN